MRLWLQVFVLVALTAILALQIPREAMVSQFMAFHSATVDRSACDSPHSHSGSTFASYVELGEEEYANRIKLARMAWQVRARAAGWLDLEDGTPLAWDELPPPKPTFGAPKAPPPPEVSAEPSAEPSLAPPSVAAPAAEKLPPLEDRRRDALLDLAPYETLGETVTNLP